MSDQNHYELLGVDRSADAATISKAWRRRTRRAGPGSPEFARLNEAAETLLDPGRRAQYDATLPAHAVPTPEPAVSADRPDEDATGTAAPAVAPVVRAGLSRTWLAAVAVLTVLTVVAVVLAVIYQGKRSDDDATATARTEASAAARTAIGVLLSYSWNTMPADRQRDQGYLSARYAKTFNENFDLLTKSSGGSLSSVAQTRTIVTVAVRGSAVMDAGPNRVNVLVFADQTVVHQAGPRKQVCPCLLNDRIKVSMLNSGGKWLVDDMQTG